MLSPSEVRPSWRELPGFHAHSLGERNYLPVLQCPHLKPFCGEGNEQGFRSARWGGLGDMGRPFLCHRPSLSSCWAKPWCCSSSASSWLSPPQLASQSASLNGERSSNQRRKTNGPIFCFPAVRPSQAEPQFFLCRVERW